MSHLGAFAAEKTPFQAPFDARIAGTWEGTTSEKLGRDLVLLASSFLSFSMGESM